MGARGTAGWVQGSIRWWRSEGEAPESESEEWKILENEQVNLRIQPFSCRLFHRCIHLNRESKSAQGRKCEVYLFTHNRAVLVGC